MSLGGPQQQQQLVSYAETLEEGLVRTSAVRSSRRRSLVVHCVGGDEEREGRTDWKLSDVARRQGLDEIRLSVVGPSMTRGTRNCSLYHDWQRPEKPDLVVMFHPGLWGYDEDWAPTLRRLLASGEPPVLVTSYTLEEAELDQEILERFCAPDDARWLWKPELNPRASKTVRPTFTAPQGHVYRENAAWQCVHPPSF